MKAVPENYTRHEEYLMSNFDGEVSKDVQGDIKGSKKFAEYSGWNFHGKVWYDGKWNCEVWTYGNHKETVSEDSLEEIMETVSDKYGRD